MKPRVDFTKIVLTQQIKTQNKNFDCRQNRKDDIAARSQSLCLQLKLYNTQGSRLIAKTILLFIYYLKIFIQHTDNSTTAVLHNMVLCIKLRIQKTLLKSILNTVSATLRFSLAL